MSRLWAQCLGDRQQQRCSVPGQLTCQALVAGSMPGLPGQPAVSWLPGQQAQLLSKTPGNGIRAAGLVQERLAPYQCQGEPVGAGATGWGGCLSVGGTWLSAVAAGSFIRTAVSVPGRAADSASGPLDQCQADSLPGGVGCCSMHRQRAQCTGSRLSACSVTLFYDELVTRATSCELVTRATGSAAQ